MSVSLEELKVDGYEKIVHANDPTVGLSAIVSIHNTNRGPACGGLRMLPYATREEALQDVLRLSRGMSYKSSLANIAFGGGKSVIIKDPSEKTDELLQAFGEVVEHLGGKYITAKDMNIDSRDLLEIKKKTSHVLGIDGVEGSSGDPSPVTARGIFRALEATVEHLNGDRSLKGLKVVVQGLGAVGEDVTRLMSEAGVTILAADINQEALKRCQDNYGVQVIDVDDVYSQDCDVFMPCAMGAILNSETIPKLKCRAVCGAANNQLATPADGHALEQRGILYAPDYAVNSGGIINVYQEHIGYDQNKALEMADGIYDTMREIFDRAKRKRIPPFEVADQVAEERILNPKK